MILLSTIIETFETEFLAQYRDTMLPGQRRALSAMKRCRTSLSPRMQAQCTECDEQVFVPHSCGHRSCPHCQNHESQQWLERQLKKQVPGEYFLLTFTLPAELRSLARRHQRVFYGSLMQASWETIRTFSENDKQLQGTPGAIAVLHTHTRRLDYHPHVHLAMPAAALDTKHRLWRTKRGKKRHGKSGYLFNHKALAKVFRAKMLAAIAEENLLLPAPCSDRWVVDCKSVGSGEKALVYLGRYLYRGVIREKDILACKDGKVTFRFQNSKTKKMETRMVPGTTFLWLVLQHVLPKNFRRARNFGFLHPNSKRSIKLLHYLLKVDTSKSLALITPRPRLACRCCGADMKIVRTRILPALWEHPPSPMVENLTM